MGWPWNKYKKDNGESSRTAAARQPQKAETAKKKRESPTKGPIPITKAVKIRSCTACATELTAQEMMRLACSHYYYTTCTSYMFDLATKQESSYPPRCCHRISLTEARDYLDRDTRKRYEKKRLEWDTKKRVYCSRNNCNAFIPPTNIDRKKATCPKCRKSTCLICKEPEHKGEPCSSDNETLRKTLRTLKEMKWQRCPECGEGIERIYGCSHMQCRCGREFCYLCGVAWTGESSKCPCLRGRGEPLAGYERQPFPVNIVDEEYAGAFPNALYGRGNNQRVRPREPLPIIVGQPELFARRRQCLPNTVPYARNPAMNVMMENPMARPPILNRRGPLVELILPNPMLTPLWHGNHSVIGEGMEGGGQIPSWPYNPSANNK